jgi:hypothetical protein
MRFSHLIVQMWLMQNLNLQHLLASILLFPRSRARRSGRGRGGGGREKAAAQRCKQSRSRRRVLQQMKRIGPVCHERPIRQRAQLKRKIPNLGPGTDAVETAGNKGELNPQTTNPKPLAYQSTTTASTDSTSARCVPAGTALIYSQNQ